MEIIYFWIVGKPCVEYYSSYFEWYLLFPCFVDPKAPLFLEKNIYIHVPEQFYFY